VGPRAGLDSVVKRKIPSPCWKWNPVSAVHNLVTILTELNFPPFMEPENSFPCSKEPSTGHRPEPDKSSSHPHTLST
jgi:hypothetical protein